MLKRSQEMLKEEFLISLGISQSALVNEKRGITTEMALKLAKYFGTSAQLWLNLQNEYDLYKTMQKKGSDINTIEQCDKIEVA